MPPRCQGTLFIPKTPEKHPRKTLVPNSAKNSWLKCFSSFYVPADLRQVTSGYSWNGGQTKNIIRNIQTYRPTDGPLRT